MDMVQSPPLSHQRLRGWQAFALLLGVLGELFLAGDWYGFAAVMPFVMKSLSLTPVEAGFTQGTFAITYELGMIFWSPLGRRMSARALFAIGLAGAGVAMVLQAQVGAVIGAACFTSTAHAQSSVTLYGLLDVEVIALSNGRPRARVP